MTTSPREKVTNTVTYVDDEDEAVYEVTVDAPEHLNVQVIPEKLKFTKKNHKANTIIFGEITRGARQLQNA